MTTKGLASRSWLAIKRLRDLEYCRMVTHPSIWTGARIAHILDGMFEVYRAGGKRTLSYRLTGAAGRGQGGGGNGIYDAQPALETHGLKSSRRDGVAGLAAANDHRQLAGLYESTHWAGAAGASRPWVQALRRIEDTRPGNLRFAGRAARCTLIPLDTALGLIEDEGPAMPSPTDPPPELDHAF